MRIPALTENTFRYGSESFLKLWEDARTLYVREIVHVNELDKEIIEETDLGNYGMYEGKKVPLDMPMEEKIPGGLASKLKGGMSEIHQQLADIHKVSLEQIEDQIEKGIEVEMEHTTDSEVAHEIAMDHVYEDPKYYDKLATIEEAEYQGKDVKLNKPKRGGSKAYYVYVKDPKTKKVKKVSFGSGGLKAKINNPKARQAFAKRHNCDKKKDKTTAGYWSCRLPRYAKALGLKSSFSGYW